MEGLRDNIFFPLSSFHLSIHQVYRKAVAQMSQGLIRRLTVLSQYEEALVKINATAAERLTALKAKPQAAIQRDLLSICNDPFTVAQQLTHIELVRPHFSLQINVLLRSICYFLRTLLQMNKTEPDVAPQD